MKIAMLIGLIALASCSSHLIKSPESKRHPASLIESSSGETVHLNSEHLKTDFEKGQFFEFVKTAQNKGIKEIVFSPEQSHFQKVSMTEETTIAGDFYLLVGTNYSTTDETIRKGDYDDLYETVRRLSWLKFRVTMNLTASVQDLKNALSNKNPTIIVWSSHGNTEAFYDFNQVKVPFNIFSKASPSVYQFILTSCNGFTALQNNYLKHMPKTIKYWGWERLVYHPSDVKTFFSANDWNPFYKYPKPFEYKGLSCAVNGEGYSVYQGSSKKFVGEFNYASLETCLYTVANSNDHFVCNRKDNFWEIYSKKNLKQIPGINFDEIYDCASRISNTYNNKLCRRLAEDNLFHYIDGTTSKVSQETFGSINDCYDYIQSTYEM